MKLRKTWKLPVYYRKKVFKDKWDKKKQWVNRLYLAVSVITLTVNRINITNKTQIFVTK